MGSLFSQKPQPIENKNPIYQISYDEMMNKGFHRNPEPTNVEFRYLFKTVIVGNPGVGKTSLLQSYVNENYEFGSSLVTIGADFMNKIVKIDNVPLRA